MKNVTRDKLIEFLEKHLMLARKERGDLVVLNTSQEDEYVIANIKDFAKVPTKSGDLVEVTIYVKDDDIFYEEYKILGPVESHPFQKFMKK